MSELQLIRLRPDAFALARWTIQKRMPSRVTDTGFVWHALLSEVYGDLAPKPFIDRGGIGYNELVGYATDKLDIKSNDPLALAASGALEMESRSFHSQWPGGSRLSFETRVRPIRQSRQGSQTSKIAETDVAATSRGNDGSIGRSEAYIQWLQEQFRKDNAASISNVAIKKYSRTVVARRIGSAEGRKWATVDGPDVWMRGELVVNSSDAFSKLITRGIGRHRAFGFGCVLLANSGYFR